MPQIVAETVAGTYSVPDAPTLFANRKRWTRDDCTFMERVGLLKGRYELIDGEIVEKVGQNRPHVLAVTRALLWLSGVFGGEFVQTQADIEVTSPDQPINRPQPDVAVLRQPDHEYATVPAGSDLRLVVEVSDTTLNDDLHLKAPLYARAQVPEYWVLDVASRRLIVHRSPRDGEYTVVRAYAEEEAVAPESAAAAEIRVALLLAPAGSPAAPSA